MIDLRTKLSALGHEIVTMAFDRAGERLALASLPAEDSDPEHPQAWVWVVRLQDKTLSHAFKLPTEIDGLDWELGPSSGPIVLDFSPNGRELAVAWELEEVQGSESGALAILDLKTNRDPVADYVMPPGDLRFSPDGTLLALNSRGPLTAQVGVQLWKRDRGWKPTGGRRAVIGTRLGFSADGKRLVVIDDDPSSKACGVTFVRVGSWSIAGRSSPVARLTWHDGPLVVAPHGTSVIGVCTLQRTRGTQQVGVWRWSPDAPAERLMPLTDEHTNRKLCWLSPEADELLWADEQGLLLRQRIGGDPTPIRPPPTLTRLGGTWTTVVSPDGTRTVREQAGQLLISRRRPAGPKP